MVGDFAATEALVTKACESGLFQDYIGDCPYTPTWHRISPHPDDPTSIPPSERPGPRGGHQMCMDYDYGKIYLLGGWDGFKDLADFWVFDCTLQIWKCISMDCRR